MEAFFQLFMTFLVFSPIILLCYHWENSLDRRAAEQGKVRVWRRGRVVKRRVRSTCSRPEEPEPPFLPPENKPYPWRPWW